MRDGGSDPSGDGLVKGGSLMQSLCGSIPSRLTASSPFPPSPAHSTACRCCNCIPAVAEALLQSTLHGNPHQAASSVNGIFESDSR